MQKIMHVNSVCKKCCQAVVVEVSVECRKPVDLLVLEEDMSSNCGAASIIILGLFAVEVAIYITPYPSLFVND